MVLLKNRLRELAKCLLLFSLTLSGAFAQVGPPPVITVQPLSQTVRIQDAVTFRVVAVSGTTMTYQWYRDGKKIGGAVRSTYTIGSVRPTDEGLYAVQVINASGSVMSSNAKLTVLVPPTLTTEPASQMVAVGQTASFSVVASGSAPLSYQWNRDGTTIPDATNSILTLTNVQRSDGGNYTVVVTNLAGSVTSVVAVLSVEVPPLIIAEPQSQTVVAGQSVSFTVVVSGTAPFTYWWYFGGLLIGMDGPGPSSTLTLNSPQTTDAGSYRVMVVNSAGSVTSAVATLIVNAPPSITADPQSQTVTAGQSASFSVVASGTSPLSYQWNLNGTAIPDATNPVLLLTNIQPADAGLYTVVVTNFVGSVTSAVATLSVNVPPLIITEPQSQTVTVGQTAWFSVEASGTAPLSYQWNFNGMPLPGHAKSTLTLNNVQTNDAGGYSAVVMNFVGSVTSVVATLSVTNPPCTTPATFVSAGMTTGGFAFQLLVSTGCNYVILASSNLIDWIPISTNIALAETLGFTDSTATNLSLRFYRVMSP